MSEWKPSCCGRVMTYHFAPDWWECQICGWRLMNNHAEICGRLAAGLATRQAAKKEQPT